MRDTGKGQLDVIVNRLGEKNKEIWGYMFNTAYTVLNNEMAFIAFPIMLNLQVKNGSDLKRSLSYR